MIISLVSNLFKLCLFLFSGEGFGYLSIVCVKVDQVTYDFGIELAAVIACLLVVIKSVL